MAKERRTLAVNVLFLSLSVLAAATFQCCGFLLSLLMNLARFGALANVTWTRPRLGGLPYLADRATRLGGLPHLSCKHDQIKMRDYMERRVTPPRWVTSPTWGPPPPCKQALTRSGERWYGIVEIQFDMTGAVATKQASITKLPVSDSSMVFSVVVLLLKFKFCLCNIFWCLSSKNSLSWEFVYFAKCFVGL